MNDPGERLEYVRQELLKQERVGIIYQRHKRMLWKIQLV